MAEAGNQKRLAAIDVGSNGIRMVMATFNGKGVVKESQAYRVAVRLGGDAFGDGSISAATMQMTIAAFRRFARLIKLQKIEHVRAVATSAVREASNGRELCRRIAEATGVKVRIIDGLEEAELAFAGVATQIKLEGRTALLIDMGGGSVEATVARDGRALACQTLRLGPVRLMQQLRAQGKSEADTELLIRRFRGTVAKMMDTQLEGSLPEIAIGTGGNIECLGKLRVQLLGKTKAYKVKLGDLDPIIEKLLAMSRPQRREVLKLRRDRADVIVIAAIVLRMVMQDAGVSKLLAPGVGVKDGLLQELARHIDEQ